MNTRTSSTHPSRFLSGFTLFAASACFALSLLASSLAATERGAPRSAEFHLTLDRDDLVPDLSPPDNRHEDAPTPATFEWLDREVREEILLQGVFGAKLCEARRARYNIEDSVSGLVITSMDQGSPFARSLHEGMVILEVNDHAVEEPSDARLHLRRGPNKLYVYERGHHTYLALRVH